MGRQSTALAIVPVKQPSPDEDPPYTCAHCGTVITTRSRKTMRDGGHQHVFANPAGHRFRIGCFVDAPGCDVQGEETIEHTWFPGTLWCYALCSGCRSQLGWRYRSSGASAFFGLILDQLIMPD